MKRQFLNPALSRSIVVDICLLAGRGPVTSVLICDDNTEVRLNLSDMLLPLPELRQITCVIDGFALVDDHNAEPADLILIVSHGLGGGADQAMSLILGMDPTAVIIIVGSVDETELLVNAYARGARGLLLWDWQPPESQTGPSADCTHSHPERSNYRANAPDRFHRPPDQSQPPPKL